MKILKKQDGISAIWIIIIVLGIIFIIAASSDTTDNNSGSSSYTSSSKSTYKTRENYSTYISKCSTIDYTTLSRSPNSYIGNNYKFTGEVIQVVSESTSSVQLRVNVTLTGEYYSYYTDTIYVTYNYYSSSNRILEEDIITIYGEFEGLYSYISVLGAEITIPKVNAMYIDIN